MYYERSPPFINCDGHLRIARPVIVVLGLKVIIGTSLRPVIASHISVKRESSFDFVYLVPWVLTLVNLKMFYKVKYFIWKTVGTQGSSSQVIVFYFRRIIIGLFINFLINSVPYKHVVDYIHVSNIIRRSPIKGFDVTARSQSLIMGYTFFIKNFASRHKGLAWSLLLLHVAQIPSSS